MFGGRVVSALDSRPKAPGSILGEVTSRVYLSFLLYIATRLYKFTGIIEQLSVLAFTSSTGARKPGLYTT